MHRPDHELRPERIESFRVDTDGSLVRRVVPKRGQPYEHRCPLDAYEHVAHTIDDMAGEPFTGDEIQRAANLPFSQVFTALAFIKERGCIIPTHGRRHKAAPGNANTDVHLDAMTEYHALREKGPHTGEPR